MRHTIARDTRKLPPSNAIEVLCAAYNQATCPWVPRTEREHARCTKLARAIMRRMYRRGDWKQTENGLCYPKR